MNFSSPNHVLCLKGAAFSVEVAPRKPPSSEERIRCFQECDLGGFLRPALANPVTPPRASRQRRDVRLNDFAGVSP